MKTSHTFKFRILNGNVSSAKSLIPSDLSFEGFCQNLRKLSLESKNPKDFIESGFQSFIESVILYFNEEIGISDYELINSMNHKYKAHGTGKRNGKIVTIFLAFNGNEFLTDGNSQVAEYFSQSCYIDGFDLSSNEKIFNIFSDSVAIHENTVRNFMENKVFPVREKTRFNGINEIKSLVDGNGGFWDAYSESLENAVNEVQSCSMDFVPDVYQVDTIDKLLVIRLTEYISGQKYESEIIDECFLDKPRFRISNNKIITFYKHEKLIVEVDMSHKRVQVIWPTGTGKNEIMMEFSIRLSKLLRAQGISVKILFISPRINLGVQGIRKIINRLKQYNADSGVEIVNFSSGEYDNDNLAKLNCDIDGVTSTTSINVLKDITNRSGGCTFVFSTYNSVDKIIGAGIKFDLINCDEAHNIVKGKSIPQDSRESVISEQARRLSPLTVFYTATQALTGTPDAPIKDGKGMDNPEMFGEVISRKTPKEMIECGKIVRPLLCHLSITKAILRKHVDISAATHEEIARNAELNAYVIWESYLEIERINQRHSVNSEQNCIKMLVKCPGGKSYSEIIKSKTFYKYSKKFPSVGIYGISSDWGNWIDGVRYESNPKSENLFLDALRDKDPDEKAIILHIAKVGEGWDVPGINAILPFGDMSDITSSQALGRGMRLHPFDRERLHKELIVPSDCYKGKFYKPFCYVVMPKYCGFSDINRNNIERMVDQIQSNIGYCPYEIFNEETYDGKMITVSPPRIEKNYTVPEEIEHEFSIILSIEERKRQEAFRQEVENEKYALRQQFENGTV